MIVTVNGVAASVEWEGFAKAREDDGPRVTLIYQVAYADGDAFADGVMGGIVVTGGVVSNLPRHKCPTNPKLYALRASIAYAAERPDGAPPPGSAPGSIGSPAFDTARVLVEYGLLTWPQAASDDPGGQQSFPNDLTPGSPFLNADCEIDFGSAVDQVPADSLQWGATPGTAYNGDPIGVDTGVMTWRITRHNYPILPYALVGNMVGGVNLNVTLGQPKGCVKLAGARSAPGAAADGSKVQRFEMVFEVKGQDWNLYPNAGTQTLVYYKGGGPLRRYVDMAPLFA